MYGPVLKIGGLGKGFSKGVQKVIVSAPAENPGLHFGLWSQSAVISKR